LQARRIGVTLDLAGRDSERVDFDDTLVVGGRNAVTVAPFL